MVSCVLQYCRQQTLINNLSTACDFTEVVTYAPYSNLPLSSGIHSDSKSLIYTDLSWLETNRKHLCNVQF